MDTASPSKRVSEVLVRERQMTIDAPSLKVSERRLV
jgi:hypothetical protein